MDTALPKHNRVSFEAGVKTAKGRRCQQESGQGTREGGNQGVSVAGVFPANQGSGGMPWAKEGHLKCGPTGRA